MQIKGVCMAGKGRPKKENPRSVNFQIRLTERDFERLSRVAERAGMKPSSFARANIVAWLNDLESK
jgi:predicted DNA-binding protein